MIVSPPDAVPLRLPSNTVELRQQFQGAAPFSHLVLDDFADAATLARISAEDFADVGSPAWTYHRYYSQATYSRTDMRTFSAATLGLLQQLASPEFCTWLSAISGVDDLRFDDQLEDGGLQATARDGYLFLHVDPLVHPRRRRWVRRINLILYTNPDYEDAWGGDLELWDADVAHCVARVAPRFNRCVLFASSASTPHGFPDRLHCPPSASRQCLALYYFVEVATPPRPHFGRLYARPGDGVGRLGVGLDNLLLHAYGRLGQTLGIDDRLINRLTGWIRKVGK